MTVALLGVFYVAYGVSGPPQPARADRALYECLDASGQRVLTDNRPSSIIARG